MYIKLVLH